AVSIRSCLASESALGAWLPDLQPRRPVQVPPQVPPRQLRPPFGAPVPFDDLPKFVCGGPPAGGLRQFPEFPLRCRPAAAAVAVQPFVQAPVQADVQVRLVAAPGPAVQVRPVYPGADSPASADTPGCLDLCPAGV